MRLGRWTLAIACMRVEAISCFEDDDGFGIATIIIITMVYEYDGRHNGMKRVAMIESQNMSYLYYSRVDYASVSS